MLIAEIMRVAAELAAVNTLVLPQVPIRFQIGPGTGAGLGIQGATYVITVNGTQYSTGQTTADGEVMVPLVPGGAVVRIFDTEYTVTIHADGLVDITTMRGRQKRLDHLGYLTGYQLTAIASDVPDDGNDGPRTQQAIMNFQTDTTIDIDGDIGPQTEQKLRDETHE
jgi:peptidoglycan hydrolase-like protein with peptidoglycan-binding domain